MRETLGAGMFTPKTDDLMKEASGQHLRVIRDFAFPFAAVIVAGAIFAGALSAAIVGGAAVWLVLPLGVIAGGSGIAAIAIVRALGHAQRVLIAIAYEFQEDHAQQRKLAEIAVNQIGPITQKGRGNTVVIGQSQVTEDVRLIPVRTSGKLVDGLPVEDVAAFIDRACLAGHSKRSILGLELPSGARVTSFGQYDQFIQILTKSGVLVGRGDRSAGHLTTNDPQAIKTLLGLPGGSEVKDVGG